MLRAFITFNLGLLSMPLGVKVWLLALMTANMVVPLGFISTTEARVVILTFLASAMLMTALTAWGGFTRLLGLGHILWVPLLVYLWPSLQDYPSDTGIGLWLRVLIVLNAISIGIDTFDVVRYLRGDRGELV
ncbi:MAG: hypothetical protein QF681_01390 [Vicinamibacterales bacterium]|jgi:hypothetical protein|nr:hypothetical protein [Vicinamibacterales bacterium]